MAEPFRDGLDGHAVTPARRHPGQDAPCMEAQGRGSAVYSRWSACPLCFGANRRVDSVASAERRRRRVSPPGNDKRPAGGEPAERIRVQATAQSARIKTPIGRSGRTSETAQDQGDFTLVPHDWQRIRLVHGIQLHFHRRSAHRGHWGTPFTRPSSRPRGAAARAPIAGSLGHCPARRSAARSGRRDTGTYQISPERDGVRTDLGYRA